MKLFLNKGSCVHSVRPSPHLDTKLRNMCIWSCSATVAIQSLDFISRNSDVAIQSLQVSCLPLKTDNFIRFTTLRSQYMSLDRPTIHTILFFAVSCTMFSVETTLKLIEDFQARLCLWDVASLDYKNRNKRQDAMHELAIKYGVSDLEMGKKNHNLKSQFR